MALPPSLTHYRTSAGPTPPAPAPDRAAVYATWSAAQAIALDVWMLVDLVARLRSHDPFGWLDGPLFDAAIVVASALAVGAAVNLRRARRRRRGLGAVVLLGAASTAAVVALFADVARESHGWNLVRDVALMSHVTLPEDLRDVDEFHGFDYVSDAYAVLQPQDARALAQRAHFGACGEPWQRSIPYARFDAIRLRPEHLHPPPAGQLVCLVDHHDDDSWDYALDVRSGRMWLSIRHPGQP